MSGTNHEEVIKMLADISQKMVHLIAQSSDIGYIRSEVDDVDQRVRKIEVDMSGLPIRVEGHDKRIVELEKWRAQVLVLATLGSMVGSGAVALAVKLLSDRIH